MSRGKHLVWSAGLKPVVRRFKSGGPVILFVLSILVLASGAGAQITDVDITSSPSPVGSGARAMGVAGAFISIADDATAASWNPAALIQLEMPEASMVLSSTRQMRQYESSELGEQESVFGSFNYLSASYPLMVGDMGFVFSINYQRLYDFTYQFERNITDEFTSQYPESEEYTEIDFSDFIDPISGLPIDWDAGTPLDPSDDYWLGTVNKNIERTTYFFKDVEQQGDLGAIAPAFAAQVTPRFAVGATFNFWMDGGLGPQWKRTTRSRQLRYINNATFVVQDRNMNGVFEPGIDLGEPDAGVPVTMQSRMKITEEFETEGFNYNLGFLFDVTPRFTLGGVYRSGFDLQVERRLKYEQTNSRLSGDEWVLEPGKVSQRIDDDYIIHFPDHVGLGLAFRISDEWKTALDLTYTTWDTFMIIRNGRPDVNAVSGLREDESDIQGSLVARWGVEYIYIGQKVAVPLRAGYVYEPLPSENGYNVYHGLALGGGIAYKNLIMDLAYNYRTANDIDMFYVPSVNGKKVLYTEEGDFQEHILLFSTIVHIE